MKFLHRLAPWLVLAALQLSCGEEEPAAPSCKFQPGGINVGYYRTYGTGGGIETCEYAEAQKWTGTDTHFPNAGSGFLFQMRTSVNPVFPSCGELWVKIYSAEAFVTGKRYEAVGWVQEQGACHTPNVNGWLEFTEYDETNQNASGRFSIGSPPSRTSKLDYIERGVFEDVAISL